MQITLSSYAVRDGDKINHAATVAKFEADLAKYEAERETELSAIAQAVHTVFDTHKGTRINMPALVSLTLNQLNAPPASFKALTERVLSYVRENSQGEVKEGVAQRPNSLFVIGKGKGGGVARRADLPAPAPAESASPDSDSDEDA